MKTYHNLYETIVDFENLYYAYRRARKGKRTKVSVAQFEQNQEAELITLQRELISFTYKPGNYHSFYIHDPKRRLISAAPFRDRVVHHALCNVIEPIWERKFIFDTYANRVGKGTHRALNRVNYFSKKYKYVLQCDIEQFFPSIDHIILKRKISKVVKDERTLWLINLLIDSGVEIFPKEKPPKYFLNDNLFSIFRSRGLPIGNLTSQFWGNLYLNDFDHFVKRELKCKAYVRYVDDFLLFGDSKKELWIWKKAIINKLAEERLSLHINQAQVFPVTTGIPFLGFRIFPEYRRVKRRKVIHFRRKYKNLLKEYSTGQLSFDRLDAVVQGWINHVRYGDTWKLRKDILSTMPITREIKSHE